MDGEEGTDATTAQEPHAPGEITANSLSDSLSIQSLHATSGTSSLGDDYMSAMVTVENIGDTETRLRGYAFEMVLYDSADASVSPSRIDALNPDLIAPGETGTVELKAWFHEDETDAVPDDVARYDVSLSCGPDSDGEYCTEDSA